MGLNMNALNEYARNLLVLAIKNNEFYEYVASRSIYRIPISDEFGNKEECVFAKMEAIYDYYKKNPKSRIDIKFYKSLKEYIPNTRNDYNILAVIRIIEYQIVAEKQNRAPFLINNIELLELLKKNLYQNQELYKSEPYQEVNFWDSIEGHDALLSSNYGHKIL